MTKQITTRRSLLGLLTGTMAAIFQPAKAFAAILTPPASRGPFYPDPAMRFDDADNDLVKIEGVVKQAGGEVVFLNGRVLDRQGKPVENARVEIWQCDVNGRYLHTGDRQAIDRDTGFQGFGHFITGADGQYEFRTIMPVSYPGRTPHIHVRVIAGGTEFISQFYIAGNSANNRDFLYNRLANDQRPAVEMVFADKGRGLETQVDIVF